MKYVARFDGEEREFAIDRSPEGLVARSGDVTYKLDLALVGDGSTFSLLVDGKSYDVVADVHRGEVVVQMIGERFVVEVEDERERIAQAIASNKSSGKRELRAAMPGIVVALKVAAGDVVEEGQVLVVLEAMKMQNPLVAESSGKITRVFCRQGEAVAAGELLLEIE